MGGAVMGGAVALAAIAGGGGAVAVDAASTASAPIRRRIPASGEWLPVIGLGTSGPFEVGDTAGERQPLAAVLQAFFAGGGTLIDTSPMYSSAEALLGDLLTADMQSRAFIATKVWTRGEREGVLLHREDRHGARAFGARA